MNDEYLIWVALLALVAVGALLLLVFGELPEIETEEAPAASKRGARAAWTLEVPAASKPVVSMSTGVGSGFAPGAAAPVEDFRAVGAHRPDRPGTLRPSLPSRAPDSPRPPVQSGPPAASTRSEPPPPAAEAPSQPAEQHASTVQPPLAGPPAPLRGVVDPPGDHHRVPGPWSKDDNASSRNAEPAEEPLRLD